jgi:hypothetical protein
LTVRFEIMYSGFCMILKLLANMDCRALAMWASSHG